MTDLQEPWQFDRRVKYLLEDHMGDEEDILFSIEGMDGQLIVALDKRLLVVKPGFVDGADFGGVVASIYYSDISGIEVKIGRTNKVIKIHTSSYQLDDNYVQNYQGNRVAQVKDFWLSTQPDSIPITRWALKKYEPHLYMLGKLVREAKEA